MTIERAAELVRAADALLICAGAGVGVDSGLPGPGAVIEIGAGTALPTVRRQAEFASAATGALVRINVRQPKVRDPRSVGMAAPAAETLLALSARLEPPAPPTP